MQATRDLDRDRATAEAVEERREADMRSFLDAQREARLDYLSDGLLNWQDIFRPFGEAARGLATGPLTRFLNTNTFFRAPAVTEEAPKLVEPLGEPYFSTESSRGTGGWPRFLAARARRVGRRRARAAGGRRGRLGTPDPVARAERLRDGRAAGDGPLRRPDRPTL